MKVFYIQKLTHEVLSPSFKNPDRHELEGINVIYFNKDLFSEYFILMPHTRKTHLSSLISYSDRCATQCWGRRAGPAATRSWGESTVISCTPAPGEFSYTLG